MSFGPSLQQPIPLLSDFYPHGEVAKRYGLFNEEQGTARRAVLIIDRDGIVRYRREYEKAADIDLSEYLAEIDKINGG